MSSMRFLPALTLAVAFALPSHADGPTEQRAEFNWMMNCQGCHRADASGSNGGAPNMRGIVSKFLSVEGGREYLAKVPGVAYAPIDDQQLAELMNWLLSEYDRENIPTGFVPYSGTEVGNLRKSPLVDDAPVMRTKLLALIKRIENETN